MGKRAIDPQIKPIILGLVAEAERAGYLTYEFIRQSMKPFSKNENYAGLVESMFELLVSLDVIIQDGKVAKG